MKNILLLSTLLLFAGVLHAENKSCSSAQDSMKARFSRKELSFYTSLKAFPKAMFYFKIDDKHYEKTILSKTKGDTTTAYMTCYNSAFQAKLDSAFRCDFFRKTDSILAAYDAQGKGYRAVEFRGGKDSLNLWLKKNVQLPASAAPNDSDTYIKVYYFLDVNEKGDVTSVRFANKTNCPECEPVVTAALKKLPPFVPATQAGVLTKSTYILPFSRKKE